MAQAGYIFGAGTPDTYESLQAKRKAADRLAVTASRAPQNVGEGLTALGQAIAYRRLSGQADRGEAAGREAYTGKRQSVLGMLMGGQMAGAGGPPAMAGATPAPVQSAPLTANPAGLPQGIIDAVDRVDPQLAPTGGQFSAIEAQYGLPAGYLDRTAMIESGGNPNAQNPNSSAGGPFQFIDSTAQAYGLTNRFDVGASADAAARLAADNREVLMRALGREPTAAELYLAHQQGGGGASALLSNPNARAVDIVGADAVRLNGGDANMTAGQFAGKWLNKFAGGGGGMPSPNGMGGGAAIPGLLELINDPFAPEGDRMILSMLLQTQMEAMQPPDPMQAPQVETFYDETTGQQYKAQWNGSQWVPVGGVQAADGPLVDMSGLQIGGAGEVGTIPQGYELFTDPTTGARRLQPLAGGPEDTSKTDAATASAADTVTDTITSAAARARSAAAGRQLGGVGQNVAEWLPWTDSAEVARQNKVLTSIGTIETLNQMRQQSPTGGALGNVTEGEGKMLAAKAGALDPNSPNYARDLDDYERTLLRVVHGKEAGDRIYAQTRLPGQPTSETTSDEEYLKSLGLE